MRHWKSPHQNRSSCDSLGFKDLGSTFLTAFTGKACFPVTTGIPLYQSESIQWLEVDSEGCKVPQIHLVPTLILRIHCGICRFSPCHLSQPASTCLLSFLSWPANVHSQGLSRNPTISPSSPTHVSTALTASGLPSNGGVNPPAANSACSWSCHFYFCFLSPLNPREWPRQGA